MYLCPECFVPLSLLSRKERDRFFFRHTIEDGRCSAVTRGELTQAEINARKYNGAKESYLHRQMKQWLVESLQASSKFTGIAQEKRWSGLVTSECRRPDVSARLGDLKLAFEVQLSTTYLNVIAERRLFYLREGGLLFWVFAQFEEDARRLAMDDVFYSNNQNAFIVSESTRDASVAAGEFLVDCVWAEPGYSNTEPSLCRDRVSFDELTLNAEKQQAYFFDYGAAKQQRQDEEARARARWPTQFEEWWLEVASHSASLSDQESEVWDFPKCAPKDFDDWGLISQTPLRFYGEGKRLPIAMLDCFYSARHGKPIGINRKHFIEVAHYLAEAYPRYLLWFRRALKVYDRAGLLREQDKKGNWQKRVQAYSKAMKKDPEKYEADQTHQLLFEFLFPELKPLPLWPNDPI